MVHSRRRLLLLLDLHRPRRATRARSPLTPPRTRPSRQYTDDAFTIDRGTTIVLFSDGLFEATNPNGHPYGFDRMRTLLAKTSRRPAADILFAILEDWRGHVGPEAPEDDTTVVVVKRRL